MAAWIMACRICFQVIFFELFMGIFVLKDLFFFCHSGQRRGICGHKNDCIQILHFVQNNSFISERQIFTEIQVYFRITVSFQKDKYYQTSEVRKVQAFSSVLSSGPEVSRQVHSVFPRFQGFNHQLGGLSGRDQVEYAVFQQAEETGSGFPAHVQVFHMDGGIVCFQ